MGLIAAVLIPIALFFWFAFCFTIIAWLKALAHLCFGQWVFHIIAGCIRRPAEGAIRKYTQSFDMYGSKGTLWIENLRSDEKP